MDFKLPDSLTDSQKCGIYGWDASLSISQITQTLIRLLDKNYSTEPGEQRLYAINNTDDFEDIIKLHSSCFPNNSELIDNIKIVREYIESYDYSDAIRKLCDLTDISWLQYKYPGVFNRL